MKKKLLRISTNTAVCILLLIISVVSFDCIESPLEPVAPTYDTKLSIPVLDTTNYFEEFPQRNTLFQFNTIDNTYSYRIPPITGQEIQIGEFVVEGLSMSFKENSVIDGIMNYEFTNRIPVEMSFEIQFLKWNETETHSDTLFAIKPDSLIKAPEVDMNGLAIGTKISKITVILTGKQVEMMAQADSLRMILYCHTGIELNSAKFRREDYIRTRSSFNACYTINKP